MVDIFLRGWSSQKGWSHTQEVPAGFPTRRGRCRSASTLKRWMHQADVDDGVKGGLTSAEQAEIVQLRRDKRRLEMENEILRRATAYFAKDHAPK